MDGVIIDVLVRHGYLVVFCWVLAEQIGLPLPAVPFLLAAGALGGNGRLSLALVLAAAALASLVSDAIWYWIGRVGGGRVSFMWYRTNLTIPAKIGSFETKDAIA
jgi:membrane protein DedA with SNARE-associated domain